MLSPVVRVYLPWRWFRLGSQQLSCSEFWLWWWSARSKAIPLISDTAETLARLGGNHFPALPGGLCEPEHPRGWWNALLLKLWVSGQECLLALMPWGSFWWYHLKTFNYMTVVTPAPSDNIFIALRSRSVFIFTLLLNVSITSSCSH